LIATCYKADCVIEIRVIVHVVARGENRKGEVVYDKNLLSDVFNEREQNGINNYIDIMIKLIIAV